MTEYFSEHLAEEFSFNSPEAPDQWNFRELFF